jgi:hypothetical protein
MWGLNQEQVAVLLAVAVAIAAVAIFSTVVWILCCLDSMRSKAYMKGYISATKDCKENAIDANLAYYKVNPKTGDVEFVWRKFEKGEDNAKTQE